MLQGSEWRRPGLRNRFRCLYASIDMCCWLKVEEGNLISWLAVR